MWNKKLRINTFSTDFHDQQSKEDEKLIKETDMKNK